MKTKDANFFKVLGIKEKKKKKSKGKKLYIKSKWQVLMNKRRILGAKIKIKNNKEIYQKNSPTELN